MTNLIFHFFAGYKWYVDLHLHLLNLYINKFDRSVVRVVYEPQSKQMADYIVEKIKGADEIILSDNNRPLGESAYFYDLMNSIRSESPTDYTFYGHSKRTGRGTLFDGRHVFWISSMYFDNLHHFDTVVKRLDQYAMHGVFFSLARHPGRVRRPTYRWHYSGTFFWFNNARVFTKPNWTHVPMVSRYSVETWPGFMFPRNQVYNQPPDRTLMVDCYKKLPFEQLPYFKYYSEDYLNDHTRIRE